MVDNEIEIVYGVLVPQFGWMLIFAFIIVITICSMRLALNFIMRKKGILPPLNRSYKKFNIIMIFSFIGAIVLCFILVSVLSLIPSLLNFIPPYYQPILCVCIAWMIAYMLIRTILQNAKITKN